MDTRPDISTQSWVMVVFLGFVWGGTFLFIEIALEGITPFWLAAARIGFAAALTSLIWIVRGAKLFDDHPNAMVWLTVVVVGAFSSAIPFMLLSWGQQFVTSGFAGVSMAAVALMVLPLAHYLVPTERMNIRKSLGFLVGFAGVFILIGAQAFESTGSTLEVAGRIACLGAAGCYAVSSVLMRLLPRVDGVGLSAVTLLVGAVIVISAALVLEGLPPMPDTKTLAILAILGLLPTATANLLRVWVIRSAGPTFMSLTNYQVPVWSVVLGSLVLGEDLPTTLLLALALILAGVALSQFGALKRLFSGRN